MDCNFTCFDRVLHLVKPLPKEALEEACDIIQNYSLIDLFDFGIEHNCFTRLQSYTLYDGIVMWENLDGNYYEEDINKLTDLHEAMGVTEEIFNKFC